MTLKYVGKRAFNGRLAEFSYSDDEEEQFNAIAEELKKCGYHIDVAIAGWAAIKVADFEETETETHGKHCA